MRRPSLRGWKDPRTRPRYIIVTGTIMFGLAAFVVAIVGVTSSYWFCANACHEVMDDAIIAYNHSPHANISCLACHSKLNADPYHFLVHKLEFGLDGGYKVLTKSYHLPPNPESEVALETPAEQCIQCHAGYKTVNPSEGMKIDHDAHKAADVACTTCHNRVAHREKSELTLAGNSKHTDFMEMEACFRCHSQEHEAKAPGKCPACHTKDFELVPDTHLSAAFYTPFGDSSGHAKLARADFQRLSEVATEKASTAEDAHGAEEGHEIPSVEEVSYCGQCHADEFCGDCHGLEIPHPESFKQDHSEQASKSPGSCVKCHADSKQAGTEFCSDCHHKAGDPAKDWFPQHPAFARRDAGACLECHTTMYCETCHVSGEPKVAY